MSADAKKKTVKKKKKGRRAKPSAPWSWDRRWESSTPVGMRSHRDFRLAVSLLLLLLPSVVQRRRTRRL